MSAIWFVSDLDEAGGLTGFDEAATGFWRLVRVRSDLAAGFDSTGAG